MANVKEINKKEFERICRMSPTINQKIISNALEIDRRAINNWCLKEYNLSFKDVILKLKNEREMRIVANGIKLHTDIPSIQNNLHNGIHKDKDREIKTEDLKHKKRLANKADKRADKKEEREELLFKEELKIKKEKVKQEKEKTKLIKLQIKKMESLLSSDKKDDDVANAITNLYKDIGE